MKKRIIPIIFLLTVFISFSAQAQDNILYNMRHLPQFANTNPAKQPRCKVFVGFPALSSFSTGIDIPNFVFKDGFEYHPEYPDSIPPWIYNEKQVMSVLQEKNLGLL